MIHKRSTALGRSVKMVLLEGDALLDLIWVQTIFKSFQQTTLGNKEFYAVKVDII